MYLATNPPAFVMRSAQQPQYAPMISRMSSGSRRAERAVEPTRSQNTTVIWRRCGHPERGDGVEKLAAVADLRDADILQIIGRQPRQHRFVDRVVAKGWRVLLQPKVTQPGRDIHAAPLFRSDARSSAGGGLIRRKKAVLNVRIGSTADRRHGGGEGSQPTHSSGS